MLWTAAAAGVVLRLWRLPRQILLFDEWHAVRGALALPLGRILTTFQMPDYSIPLTALYRLMLRAGVRPSEMTLRLPVLLSGFLLLFLAPLAFAALVIRRAGAAGGPRRWPALAAVGGVVAALMACLLLPALPSLLLLIGEKHKPQALPWGDVLHLAPLFAGTAVVPAIALFWLAAAIGLAAAWRTDRRFAVYGAVLVAAQLAGILVLAPKGMRNPQVLARYLVICLPWVLVWVAPGLTWLPRRWNGRWRDGWRWAAAAAFGGALALGGPIARQTFLRTSLAHHMDFLLFSCEPRRVPLASVPEFYARLGPRPGGASS